MEKAVKKFRGEYAFLSNMHPASFIWDGRMYLNSEAAFQSAKCLDAFERDRFSHMDGKTAKREGKKVAQRKDWAQVKVGLMKEIVTAKFAQNADLLQLLIATGDMELIEGNHWHDTFWGVDLKTGSGENHLGQILMAVRAELGGEAWHSHLTAAQEDKTQKKAQLDKQILDLQAQADALTACKFCGKTFSTQAFGKVTILRQENNYLFFSANGQEKSFALPGCILQGFLIPDDPEITARFRRADELKKQLEALKKERTALE